MEMKFSEEPGIKRDRVLCPFIGIFLMDFVLRTITKATGEYIIIPEG